MSSVLSAVVFPMGCFSRHLGHLGGCSLVQNMLPCVLRGTMHVLEKMQKFNNIFSTDNFINHMRACFSSYLSSLLCMKPAVKNSGSSAIKFCK